MKDAFYLSLLALVIGGGVAAGWFWWPHATAAGWFWSPQVDQSKLCLFQSDAQARQCEAGTTIYYKPEEERSPQGILNVAAAYCDFNYPVIHNNGGLLCVMTRKRLSLAGR